MFVTYFQKHFIEGKPYNMKALRWNGKNDIRWDPKIEDARDVIIKVSCCADLRL